MVLVLLGDWIGPKIIKEFQLVNFELYKPEFRLMRSCLKCLLMLRKSFQLLWFGFAFDVYTTGTVQHYLLLLTIL